MSRKRPDEQDPYAQDPAAEESSLESAGGDDIDSAAARTEPGAEGERDFVTPADTPDGRGESEDDRGGPER